MPDSALRELSKVPVKQTHQATIEEEVMEASYDGYYWFTCVFKNYNSGPAIARGEEEWFSADEGQRAKTEQVKMIQ